MGRPWFALIPLLGLAACCGAPGAKTGTDPSARDSLSVPRAPVPAERAESFGRLLRGLELSFLDGSTGEVFAAAGPYTYLRGDDSSLEFMGHDRSFGEPVAVTVLLDDLRMWVRATIRGREFVTRIQ